MVSALDTLILCGGLGTRLRSAVPDRPKALAEVAGRPFLDVLLSELRSHGLRRFILCTGHGAAQIVARYRGRPDAEYAFSTEDQPLGTAGAIAHALPLVRSDPLIVINGDSFCLVPYAGLLDFHHARKALLTIVGIARYDRADAGAIRADTTGRILEFAEKSARTGEGLFYTSAGIYVMTASAIASTQDKTPCSLEFDLFPKLVASGRCFVFAVDGPLIDIGTPERLQAASELLPKPFL